MLRSILIFALLLSVKLVSRIFYRFDFRFVGDTIPPDPWSGVRLVAFLNHTSLFEPVFLGVVPPRFLWRIARHGVVPAADKTTGRPLVGLFYRSVAQHVVAITRERDQTWVALLQKIDPDSMVVIAPEGRMMRLNGLDGSGQPMTVRGGIADVLEAIPSGRFLIAYSGGLHHVQAPGDLMPRLFRTVRMRVESVDIADYRNQILVASGIEGFKRAVRNDLERRRDRFAPVERHTCGPNRQIAP